MKRVIAFVGNSSGDGASAEAIRRELKLDRREVPKLLAMALDAKRIRRTGAKRGTRYFPA